MCFGSDAPTPPDPTAVANAQSAANIKTAQAQQQMGMTGQVTPTGSVQYVQDPTSPSGFRAVTTLSPEEQALLQQGQDLQAQYGGVAGAQLGRASDTMATPFDLNAARGTQISDIQKTFLDPQWDQRQEQLQAQLLNQGIRPGSQAYQDAMTNFNNQRSGSYDQMFLDAYNTANNAALQNRNIPIQDLQALGGGAMPMGTQPVQPANVPQPGVAPTDVEGPVEQQYQAQLASYNADMGGLFGLGSSLLGGWAKSGFVLPA